MKDPPKEIYFIFDFSTYVLSGDTVPADAILKLGVEADYVEYEREEHFYLPASNNSLTDYTFKSAYMNFTARENSKMLVEGSKVQVLSV